ncbi:hypothetical protein [Marinirhabdus gelatinilytica]|uniref:Adhesin n=1 Tax=Marinirhabdus gelatinilytica TaxID=1703343 RepID=A0A370QAE3_9FLAO|nr:hypothetical protein [Marinirhabdus gelatinilytica]RDK85336.1 hypothetical protein C8D94_103160 [Marinirhabdus gelatinilytica]
MKHIYNILLVVLLLPITVTANTENFKGKHTKEKKIHKEYTVNPNAGLEIDNRYGNITIVTWNQNKTVIDVTIKTNGNNEEKVSEKLKEIDVEFSASGTNVNAKTRFGNKSRWNSWFGSGNSNISVEVNYTIKLPIGNSVNINNDYGSITIDKLEGHATINCDYGQLVIGELLAEDNSLNFDYTKNSTIQYMKSGKINADYSGVSIQKTETLLINADYSNTDIGEVNNLNYNNDHGKLNIGKVGTVIGRGDYIHHNIGSVTNSLNIHSDYGAVNVGSVLASCKEITINSDYARINLGLPQDVSFNFKLNLDYTNLKGTDGFQYSQKSEKNSSKMYMGHFGKKDSGTIVTINSNYGGITFNKL